MQIYNMERGSGKTTFLIKEALRTGYPIVCATEMEKRNKESKIEMLKDEKVIPIDAKVNIYTVGEIRGLDIKEVLIDDLDYFLRSVINCKVYKATIT